MNERVRESEERMIEMMEWERLLLEVDLRGKIDELINERGVIEGVKKRVIIELE